MQPLSGGCVLKLLHATQTAVGCWQPPSGGCVLKPLCACRRAGIFDAATFGWLCVETMREIVGKIRTRKQPPSGGCVLKLWKKTQQNQLLAKQPPSGGCVLKPEAKKYTGGYAGSRLRVAVC